MIPKQQEVNVEPGLKFDIIVQNSLSKLEPEDGKRQNEFDLIFNHTQEAINDDSSDTIRIEQFWYQGKLKRQIWKVQFTNPEDKESDYAGKVIEGLLVLPNNFPEKAPKFYFGFFKDNTKIIHENIYGDGLLCIPNLTNNWVKTRTATDALLAIQAIFFEPNLVDPANPMYAQVPEIEKKRRRKQQAKLLENWS